ncbi:hypothetical protein M422DRAFT_185709, partial [Sphaerobolus stellatus SS14]
RFRLIPTFGQDTIRRFAKDVSELSKLGARDYEDILQCCLPVLQGLLPEPHNSVVLNMVFTLSHWHALAKLRMHTDSTLEEMDKTTTKLGEEVRKFDRVTCSQYETHKLDREQAAQQRRKACKQRTTHPTNLSTGPSRKKKKSFNYKTLKYHALGDYVPTIRRMGSILGYSTQMVSPIIMHSLL